MNKNGKVKLDTWKPSEKPPIWDITIINDEITFFSNGYYLDVTKSKNGDKEEIGEEIAGYKYMIVWKFIMLKKYYMFFYSQKGKENILSSENNILKVKKEVKTNENELFEFLDVTEE